MRGFLFSCQGKDDHWVGREKSEHQLFALLHQQPQARGPISPSGTQASVCAGSVMGPYRACSPNKGSVSATVRHKGQRSPVYFGLETFK